MSDNASGQVVVKSQKKTLTDWLESQMFNEAIAKALPKHLTAERFIRMALTAMNRTPKLALCTQDSLFQCLLDLSAMGLEPDGRRAHLIPYENHKTHTFTATLIVDYKGIVELVQRSGVCAKIHADMICENDEFEYDKGEIKRHRIDFRNPRGKALAYYCIIYMKDGSEKAEVMSMEEIYAIRDRSQGYQQAMRYNNDKTPWLTDEPEMGKKTVFKRASKWVTLSPEIREVVDRDDPLELERRLDGSFGVFAPNFAGLGSGAEGLLPAPDGSNDPAKKIPVGATAPVVLTPKPEPKGSKGKAAQEPPATAEKQPALSSEDLPWTGPEGGAQ
jgi:recombination protein RecT